MVNRKKSPGMALKREEDKLHLTAVQREEMIRVAAYFKAEKNNFSGNPSQFWSEAEKEIDSRLRGKPVTSGRK